MGYRTIPKQCARPWHPPMNCDGLKFRPNFVANLGLHDATTMIDVGCFHLATDLFGRRLGACRVCLWLPIQHVRADLRELHVSPEIMQH